MTCTKAIIDKIGGGKPVSKERLGKIKGAYYEARRTLELKNRDNAEWNSKSEQEKIDESAQFAINDRKAQLFKQRQKVVENLANVKNRREEVIAFGGGIEGTSRVFASVRGKGDALSQKYKYLWRNGLDGIKNFQNSVFGYTEETIKDLRYAFTGEGEASPKAVEIKNLYNRINDELVSSLNKLGVKVGKVGEFYVSHSLSPSAIGYSLKRIMRENKIPVEKAEAILRQELISFHMEKDDRSRIYNDEGQPVSEPELLAIVTKAVDDIMTNGAASKDLVSFVGKGGSKVGEKRVLHLKNVADEFDYIEKFTGESPLDLMSRNIERLSHTIAITESLGTNPIMTGNTLINDALKQMTTQRAAKHRKRLEVEFDYAMGRSEIPVDSSIARAMDNIKMATIVPKLKMQVVSQLIDLVSMANVNRLIGASHIQQWKSITESLTPTQRKEWAIASEMFTSNLLHHMDAFIAENNMSGAALKKLAGFQSYIQGASGMTNALKTASGMSVTSHLARMTKTAWKDLDEGDRSIWKSYGIDERLWGLLGGAERLQFNDKEFVTPSSLMKLSDDTIKNAYLEEYHTIWDSREAIKERLITKKVNVKKELKKATADEKERLTRVLSQLDSVLGGYDKATAKKIADWTESRRVAVAGQFFSGMQTLIDEAVVSPTFGQKASRAKIERGTFKGEAEALFLALKTWPMAMLNVQTKIFKKILDNRGAIPAATHTAIYITSAMAAAVISLQAKNIINGRELEDMTTPRFLGKAFFQAGLGGIYSDLVSSYSYTSGGKQGVLQSIGAAAGPVVGDAAGILAAGIDIGVGAVSGDKQQARKGASDLLKQTMDTIPIVNNIYTATAWNRLVTDSLADMVNPNYTRKLRESAYKNKVKYTWEH